MDQEVTEIDDEEPKRRSYHLDDLVGHVLDGRYEIDERIGMGAMGAVFRARQLRLRRTVAIKVPKPEILQVANYRGRFEREALTMAKLVHQNIVQIFDVYISDQPQIPSFIAMEFVEGREFGEYLKLESSNLTVSAVLLILEQIASGLDAAHAFGVVHRDVKPANIFITMPQRIPKIMDFGIAKVEIDDAFQTINMETLGTPAYMSPEQVTGGEISSKTDVYSFGVMVYKVFTGLFPYEVERADIRQVMQAHVSQNNIPASRRNTGLPDSLDKVFERVLAKDPDARFSTATDFIKALRHGLGELEHQPFSFFFPDENSDEPSMATNFQQQRKKERQQKYLLIGLSTTIVVLLAVAIGVYFSGSDSEEPKQLANVQAQQNVSITNDPPQTPTPATPEPIQPTPFPSPAPSPTPVATPFATLAETPKPEPRVTSVPVVIIPDPTQVPTPIPTPVVIQQTVNANSPLQRKPTEEPISSIPLKTAMNKRFKDLLDQQIEKPSFYNKFTEADNALVRMGGSEAETLVQRINNAQTTHSKVDLSFRIAPESLYWDDYCVLQVEPTIRAYPLNHPDRNFRELIYVAPSLVSLVIEKNSQGEWNLVCLGCH